MLSFLSTLVWIQRGLSPKIETSRLDGSERRILHSSALSWPEDVAFDTLRDVIFWTDSKLRTIEMSFADGSGRRIIRKYSTFSVITPLRVSGIFLRNFYTS